MRAKHCSTNFNIFLTLLQIYVVDYIEIKEMYSLQLFGELEIALSVQRLPKVTGLCKNQLLNGNYILRDAISSMTEN